MVSIMDVAKPRLGIWTQQFLSNRSLLEPDGRPLYAYRTSDQEYAALSELLKNHELSPRGLDGAAFSMAWLLYAAEWWKRSYEGGAWAWNPVFANLSLTFPGYVVCQQYVIAGRKAWRLSAELGRGKRYLGLVAIQGGLPLRLIESSHGNLVRLLKAVLRQTITCRLTEEVVQAEIQHHCELLPSSYRQPTIYRLLAEVVQAVQGLHHSYCLYEAQNPVEVLDSRYPQWMDHFPLRLDDDSARSLLTGLIEAAVDASRSGARLPVQMRRSLRFGTEDNCRLDAAIDIAPRTTPKALADLFNGASTDLLPPSFELTVEVGGREFPLADGVCRDGVVRLVARPLPTSLANSTVSVRLRLIRLGKTLFDGPLPGSDTLELDMPWVFKNTAPSAPLVGIGSCSTRDASVLLCLPTRATVFNEDSDFDELSSPVPERNLYRVHSGVTRILLADGIYRIRCAQEHSDDGMLCWGGQLITERSEPVPTYRGMPSLRRVAASGTSPSIAQGEFLWKTSGKPSTVSFRSPPVGMGTLLWMYADTIQTRLKMVCLPADASVEVSVESDSQGGVLWLRSWPALGVGCESDSCSLVAEQHGCDWKLNLRARDHSVPAEVTLTLAWPGNQTQHLIVPFPATGAVFIDPEGRRMQPHQRIDVNDLLGSRLRLLPGKHRRHWLVCLFLRDSAKGRPLLTRTLKYGVSEEIRLLDYIRPIQEMLACTEALDATVTIECQELNTSVASIQVGRYIAKLQRDLDTGAVCFPHAERIPEGGIEALGIFTVPISHPDDAPERLKQARSEDSYLRRWWFNPGSRESGPWLIFPDTTSRSAFRPFIWAISQPNGQPQPKLSGLRLALSLATAEERYAALSAAADHLVAHPEDDDWFLLEAIVENLGHLPLSGLDVWRVFSTKPRAMIMALLHCEGFAGKLAGRVSEELPYEWLLGSPADWIACVRTLQSFWLAEGRAKGFARTLLECRSLMEIAQPGLLLAIDLARHLVVVADDRSAKTLITSPRSLLVQQQHVLNEPKGSSFHMLLRRDDDEWPSLLKHEIATFLNTSAVRAFFEPFTLDRRDYKWSVIGFPIWLGFEVAQDRSYQWLANTEHLHALRLYRDFDREWFDTAYRLGQILAFSTDTAVLN